MSEFPTRSAEAARRMLGPAGPELSCEECFVEVDRYVEVELADEAADSILPGMRAHLEGCAACREEYLSLRALVVSESGR